MRCAISLEAALEWTIVYTRERHTFGKPLIENQYTKFKLAEIKTLDDGSWFDKKFAGEKIVTFDEAVALIRGKAGLFPELKTPEIYAGRDVNVEVETSSELTMGQTVIDWWGATNRPRNATVIREVDDDAFFALLLERIGRL